MLFEAAKCVVIWFSSHQEIIATVLHVRLVYSFSHVSLTSSVSFFFLNFAHEAKLRRIEAYE